MKQKAQVANHHREETLVEEVFYPEVVAEEEIFDALHVVSGEMGHGIVLTIYQKIR